ncbi:MAG: hypothetical protein QCI82_06885 [Candidatus Thermoplasmatota archaeon]|nr:hypothetical protein [Candidatus Thermoplasmatota archaeon]
MRDRRWTMYAPVVLVLFMSVPLVFTTLYGDFQRARTLAGDVVGSSSFFKGISDDKTTTVSIVPDVFIDRTIPDARENVTLTNQTGGQQEVNQSTPKGAILKGILNALVMVGIAIISAFGLFFLFKRRRKLTLKMIFAGAIWMCSSLSLFLYIYMFRDFLKGALGIQVTLGAHFYIFALVAGFSAGTYIVLNMVFRSLEPRRKNPALIAFTILLGPFLAVVLPISFVIFLLIGVSLWDLWAAKRGVIKDIVTESEKERSALANKPSHRTERSPSAPAVVKKRRAKGLLRVDKGEDITSYGLYEGKHYSLGIGDFIFFSLLSSTAFTWFMLKMPWMGYYQFLWGELIALLFTVLVACAIILGLKQTLSYLEKDSIMPGLPLSVLWGLIAFLACALLVQAMNLIFYGSMVNPF